MILKTYGLFDKSVPILIEIFNRIKDKREAHSLCQSVLLDLVSNKKLMKEIISKLLMQKNALNKPHYPALNVEIFSNSNFSLVANCWIPLQDSANNVTTTSIHHHGSTILTTITALGSGYQHLVFSPAIRINNDDDNTIFNMQLESSDTNSVGQIAFVDSFIPHVPMYPKDFTVTLAIFSEIKKKSFKSSFKNFNFINENKKSITRILNNLRLSKLMGIDQVNYYDFYPSKSVFKGLKQRKLVQGPVDDYLNSLAYTIQYTNNEELIPLIFQNLKTYPQPQSTHIKINYLINQLKNSNAIDNYFSPELYNTYYANYNLKDIIFASSNKNS